MDNSYLNIALALPRDGEEPAFTRVRKRLKDENGNPIGEADKNPILDTTMFVVEFLDGSTMAISASTIAENVFAQVDQEGHRLMYINKIADHRTTHRAIKEADAFTITKGVIYATKSNWDFDFCKSGACILVQ